MLKLPCLLIQLLLSANGDNTELKLSTVTSVIGMSPRLRILATSFANFISSMNQSIDGILVGPPNMNGTFVDTGSFNQPLDGWDTTKVTTIAGMFQRALSFNQPLDSYVITNVTNTRRCFAVHLHSTNHSMLGTQEISQACGGCLQMHSCSTNHRVGLGLGLPSNVQNMTYA